MEIKIQEVTKNTIRINIFGDPLGPLEFTDLSQDDQTTLKNIHWSNVECIIVDNYEFRGIKWILEKPFKIFPIVFRYEGGEVWNETGYGPDGKKCIHKNHQGAFHIKVCKFNDSGTFYWATDLHQVNKILGNMSLYEYSSSEMWNKTEWEGLYDR